MTSLLPAEFNTVTLTGQYVNLDGTPVEGYLTFEASPTILRAAESKDLIVPVQIYAGLDKTTGAFTVSLPATDDPDINPDHWTYQVVEGFGSRRSYSIQILLEAGTNQNIFDLAPVAKANGTYYELGPTGPAGPPALIVSGMPASTVGGTGDYAIDPVAGILYGPKTQVTGWGAGTHLAATDIATHAAKTTTHGVAGLLVGTTDTQSLSNKILVAPAVTGGLATDSLHATGAAQIDGNATITGDLGARNITGNIVAANEVTIANAPSAVNDAARKDYVDTGSAVAQSVNAATSTGTASTLMKRDATNGVSVGSVYIGNAPSGANHATRKDYVDAADTARRLDFTVPNAGTRQYVRLARLTGTSATSGAILSFLLTAGDYGTAGRVTYLVNAIQRGTGICNVQVYAFGTSKAQTPPIFYTQAITTVDAFTYDLWAYFPAYNDTQSLVVLASGRATVYCDSATPTAPTTPTALSAAITPTELGDAIANATANATANTVMARDSSGNVSLNMLSLGAQQNVVNSATRKDYVDGNFQAVTGKNAASGYVGLDGSSNATVAGALKANTLESVGQLYLDQLSADPASPGTAGQAALWKATDHGIYVISNTIPKRRLNVHWGTGATFPTNPIVGDTCFRSDIGTNGSLWAYAGTSIGISGWVPEAAEITCLSSTRPASGVRFVGLTIYETNTLLTRRWDGTYWEVLGWRGTSHASANLPQGYAVWSTASVPSNSASSTALTAPTSSSAGPAAFATAGDAGGALFTISTSTAQVITCNAKGRVSVDVYAGSDNPTAGYSQVMLTPPTSGYFTTRTLTDQRATGYAGAGHLDQWLSYTGLVLPGDTFALNVAQFNTGGSTISYTVNLVVTYL